MNRFGMLFTLLAVWLLLCSLPGDNSKGSGLINALHDRS